MPLPEAARANLTRWTEGLRSNAFDADPHLASILAHHGRADVIDDLRAFGAVVSEKIDPLAIESNRDENLPRLRRYDGQGNRIEQVEFHPSYHEIGRLAYATGAMTRYRDRGRETETLAFTYLLAQDGESGHACPFACTAGMIKILQLAAADGPGPIPAWLDRLLDSSYDRHFHAAQFLTEVQGGSDVGANALVAEQDADGWLLTGEKWFCSVSDAQMFLVTGRAKGGAEGTRGVLAFAVPRTLPDGTPNAFALRRLKVKLGTRSMASAEIDFLGARAWPVGDFRRVVEVVLNTSRLYNAICSAGMAHRAWREADGWARTREAFGVPIVRFPAVAAILARLRTETYAARSVTFALAALADRIALGEGSEADSSAYRMIVNLNKYWTAHMGTAIVRDAIEVIGGNGTIEEFTVLPRLLRDSIVCEAWEGGHNVLCAQALRDSQRLGLHHAMFAWLEGLAGPSARLDAVRARWERVIALPEEQAAVTIRAIIDELRPVAQVAALRAESAGGGTDPRLDDVIEHLLATTERGWDPLDDAGYLDRIHRING